MCEVKLPSFIFYFLSTWQSWPTKMYSTLETIINLINASIIWRSLTRRRVFNSNPNRKSISLSLLAGLKFEFINDGVTTFGDFMSSIRTCCAGMKVSIRCRLHYWLSDLNLVESKKFEGTHGHCPRFQGLGLDSERLWG